ncbi:MAG: DUF4364 family protein [Oscillospiraceae bacterium]|nr:DUF4364 family protein [Oscillospiraceae bacterium]
MKKHMLEENLMKISELADRMVTDPAIASILLCYLLYRVEQPVEEELLYDICVTGGIINFFTYRETIALLQENGSIRSEKNAAHETVYTVTAAGVDNARKLRSIAKKSYRDQLVSEVKLAIRRKKNQKDATITYEPLERGCHLHVVLKDRDTTLLDLRLFTPDEETAKQLGDRILTNPSVLYHDVLKAVLTEHEEPMDLSDN